MPDVSGVPGGSSPNQVGQFYVPQSEWNPNPLDEDLYSPPTLNRPIVSSLFLAASFLVPWAGSYDESVIPLPLDEESWIAPVLPPQRFLQPVLGANDEIVTPLPTVVDEEYNHKAPVIWPQQFVRLTWPDEDTVVNLQGIDNDEWAPKLVPQLKFGSLLLWTGSDELPVAPADETEWLPGATRSGWLNSASKLANSPQDEIERLTTADDEGWLPPSTKTPWQSSLANDPSGDFAQAPPVFEEDSWIPVPPVFVTTVKLLVGGSEPLDVALVVVDEDYNLQVSKNVTSWYPRIVSDSTDYPVPTASVLDEESWIPVPPIFVTNVRLLVGGIEPPPDVTTIVDEDYKLQVSRLVSVWTPSLVSDPTDYPVPVALAIDELPQGVTLVPPVIISLISPWSYGGGGDESVTAVGVVDEDYLVRVSKNVISWYPSLVSDPTDYSIPIAIAFDELAQGVTLVPPVVISVVSPWSYGGGEDAAPSSAIESEWINPVVPITLKYDARFVSRDSGELALFVSIIGDEPYDIAHIPLQILVGPKVWSFDQSEIVPAVIAPPIVSEDYAFVYIPKPRVVVQLSQWLFEQHETFTPAPPEVCIEGPVSVTITVETPGGSVITLEGPMVITLASESPTALGVTLEEASPLSLVREVPTETECND